MLVAYQRTLLMMRRRKGCFRYSTLSLRMRPLRQSTVIRTERAAYGGSRRVRNSITQIIFVEGGSCASLIAQARDA